MAVFENHSGAYFMYVSSGSAENRHLQAAMATFGAGSDAAYEQQPDLSPRRCAWIGGQGTVP